MEDLRRRDTNVLPGSGRGGAIVKRQKGRDLVSEFGRGVDPGVILRAHRFRAEIAGFRIVRGQYMDGERDRADRWYVVPLADLNPERTGPGFKGSAEAAEEAERRAATLRAEADHAP